MWWLLEAGVLAAMESAQREGFVPSAEQQDRFLTTMELNADQSRIMSVAGNIAQIKVHGVLTARPDFMAMLFGGGNTTYSEIIAAAATAQADPAISRIDLDIDSPGGSLHDLFVTMAAIKDLKKPTRALVRNVAASAAFGIAAQADEIVAVNQSVQVGSVGVAVRMFTSDRVVDIASTEAPKKRPDVSTEAGRAVVREELDPLHDIFVDAIAAGRGTTRENVNAEFGQGATVLADEALKRGMIDGIAAGPQATENVANLTAGSGGEQSETTMDLKQLKAEHPDVYAAAAEEGAAEERDRVGAHLTMGENFGAMKTALAAVADGSKMTATLQATYLSAGQNRQDLEERAAADEQASGADGADESTTQDEGDTVANALDALLGVSTGGAV